MENNQQNMGNIVIYETEDGLVNLDVHLQDDNIWLSMNQMAQLFDRDRSVIYRHIKNIFEENELQEKSNVQILHIANSDKPVEFYSLDVVISVGYRVKSKRGIQFRVWASQVLKEYIKKGYTLDDERLKNLGGGNYWKDLLDRIRDIRSSEKVMYRQVLDLYATSMDYDPRSEETIEFFKIVQNKFHYATNNMTAAEVIYDRADSKKLFMGLKTFTGDMPKKKDIKIAKNYLDENELRILNNLVSGYFDLAEVNALEHRPMYMRDYIENIDNLLRTMNRPILEGSGNISHEKALEKAEKEYKKYVNENLSNVEKEYLATINTLDKKAKGKNRNI